MTQEMAKRVPQNGMGVGVLYWEAVNMRAARPFQMPQMPVVRLKGLEGPEGGDG